MANQPNPSVGSDINSWGIKLNTKLTDHDNRLDDLEAGGGVVDDAVKLKSWQAAIANRTNRAVNVGVLGASLSESYRVTNTSTSIEQRLAYLLNYHHPVPALATHGRGYFGVATIGSSGIKQTATTVDSWPQIYNGGAFDDTTFSIGAKHRCWYSTSTTQNVVHTLTEGASSIDIHIALGAGGAASAGEYQINALTPVTFNTYNATTIPAKVNVVGPFTAGSTVKVRTVTNGKAILFSGVREYNGDETKGFQVHNFGHAGWNTLQWATGGSSAPTFAEIAAFNLDLLVLPDLGINDAATLNGNMTAAAYKTNLLAFIAILRTAGVSCPILLGAGHDIFGAGTAVYSVDPWASYVTVMKEVAAADNTIVFGPDNSTRLPKSTDANSYGLFNGPTDLLHSNPNGALYLAYAENIYAAIRPN